MKQPFEGDELLAGQLNSLIKEFDIDVVIETGTETGATAKAFAGMVDTVFTCDIENKVDRDLPNNVVTHIGDSLEFLDDLCPVYERNRVLFFLDAHLAPKSTQLLAELDFIAERVRSDIVIVIHDFQVPGNDELGYDTYTDIGPICTKLVDSRLRAIFSGEGYNVRYNRRAEGAKRGVGIFYAYA